MIQSLEIAYLRVAYRNGALSPRDVIEEVYRRIEACSTNPIWINLVPKAQALERAQSALDGPLSGIPFAVKDNIDVAGMPTTAGCPEFAYTPERSAEVVERLLAQGAILIGKTNLDQFATGLVGTRSPYGVCRNAFDERYISGGSSSGSAVAVALKLVSFSLGTDTAGSGRVPAAFQNLYGVKPSRNVISTVGVVPACKTLDCVSIFANTAADAGTVLSAAGDLRPAPSPWLSGAFRFGVPHQLEFFGDTAAEALFQKAAERLQAAGGVLVPLDYAPFQAVAELLYSGPWVAERFAAIQPFFQAHAEAMDPTVRAIIAGGASYSAADTWNAIYKLEALSKQTGAVWSEIDVMLLPTTGTIYTIEQVLADPVRLNSNLGFYTNFVNLLDLAALALPAGFRADGLPFGVSLIGPRMSDMALLKLADRVNGAAPCDPLGCVKLAVVGAHLSGQPLNGQLVERGARLIKTCRTAPGYRLYALAATLPPKPGLIRDDAYQGEGIEVEVWAMPTEHFGSFTALVPAPLAIGSAVLDDGNVVKSFVCEPYAIPAAREITALGGWRNYLAEQSQNS